MTRIYPSSASFLRRPAKSSLTRCGEELPPIMIVHPTFSHCTLIAPKTRGSEYPPIKERQSRVLDLDFPIQPSPLLFRPDHEIPLRIHGQSRISCSSIKLGRDRRRMLRRPWEKREEGFGRLSRIRQYSSSSVEEDEQDKVEECIDHFLCGLDVRLKKCCQCQN